MDDIVDNQPEPNLNRLIPLARKATRTFYHNCTINLTDPERVESVINTQTSSSTYTSQVIILYTVSIIIIQLYNSGQA